MVSRLNPITNYEVRKVLRSEPPPPNRFLPERDMHKLAWAVADGLPEVELITCTMLIQYGTPYGKDTVWVHPKEGFVPAGYLNRSRFAEYYKKGRSL